MQDVNRNFLIALDSALGLHKSIFRVTGILFASILLIAVPAAVLAQEIFTLALPGDKALHFGGTDGSDQVVEPGVYAVRQGGGNSLILTSGEGDEISVATQLTSHNEEITEAALLAEARTDDELHLLLLLPNRQALDAVATYSGIRSRAASTRQYQPNQIAAAKARASARAKAAADARAKAAAVARAKAAADARAKAAAAARAKASASRPQSKTITVSTNRTTLATPITTVTKVSYPSPSRPPAPTRPVYKDVKLTWQGVGGTELHSYKRSGPRRTLNIAGQTFIYEDVDGIGILDGDIVLGPVSMLQQFAQGIRPRGVVANPVFGGVPFFGARWPGAVVPFQINNNLSASMRDIINQAIQHWEDNTRVDFRPRTAQDQNFVEFRDGDGCSSLIGMQGGRQFINLRDGNPGCRRMGIVVHEIGHALGLFHEQSRCDRNEHIQIRYENVLPEKQHNFWQACVIGLDIAAYNFGSIMHYSDNAFSEDNNSSTIVPKSSLPPGVVMGQRTGLSPGDIAAFNSLYPTPASPISSPETAITQITYEVESILENATGNAVTPGTYFLRCERDGKLLDITGSCMGQDQCETQLWDIGQSSNNNRFEISKSEGIGYRIKNSNKFLEVDFWRITENGVTPWMMGYAPVPQQDWLFYEVGENRFVIRNVLSSKVLDARNSCVNQNGCKVQQSAPVSNDLSQVWVLEPAS